MSKMKVQFAVCLCNQSMHPKSWCVSGSQATLCLLPVCTYLFVRHDTIIIASIIRVTVDELHAPGLSSHPCGVQGFPVVCRAHTWNCPAPCSNPISLSGVLSTNATSLQAMHVKLENAKQQWLCTGALTESAHTRGKCSDSNSKHLLSCCPHSVCALQLPGAECHACNEYKQLTTQIPLCHWFTCIGHADCLC